MPASRAHKDQLRDEKGPVQKTASDVYQQISTRPTLPVKVSNQQSMIDRSQVGGLSTAPGGLK